MMEFLHKYMSLLPIQIPYRIKFCIDEDICNLFVRDIVVVLEHNKQESQNYISLKETN